MTSVSSNSNATTAVAASVTNAVTEKPCWSTGGEDNEEACSLTELLRTVDRSTAILWESNEYLALNKPADLRMDGKYAATVHKLLTYWYPPPSLQSLRVEMGDEAWREHIVTNFHWHSDHPDNELRPCHQLDYATSGVLLVARTRQAAHAARLAFEHRQTSKEYVAIVHGHVSSGAEASSPWPQLEADEVKRRLQKQEDTFRRQRRKRKPETFPGYLPPHALFQTWQQHARRRRQSEEQQEACSTSNKNSKPTKKSRLTEEQWNVVWDTVETVDRNESAEVSPLDPGQDWKQVKRMKRQQPFIEAARVYNQFVVQREEELQSSAASVHDMKLPTFFTVTGDGPNVGYVFAPLAEVEDFAMRLPPDLQHKPPSHLQVGTAELVYRPALTQYIVVERGYIGDRIPATKVRLVPWTGRRHQLRVHTALLGHPIMGDQTYENPQGLSGRSLLNQMCLHSQKLELHLATPIHVEATDPLPTLKRSR